MKKIVNEMLFKFKGSKSPEQMVRECKVLTYLAFKNNAGYINLKNIDLSDHNDFNNMLLNACDNCKDKQTTVLLKDIIVSGIIRYSDELNEIYKYLLRFTPEGLQEIMDYLYDYLPSKHSKYLLGDFTDTSLANLVYKLSLINAPKEVLDICSGQGNFLSQFKKDLNIKLYGFEINPELVLLSKLRLNMYGLHYNVMETNVLYTSMSETADLVFSEYPWGLRMQENVAIDKNNTVDYNIGKYRTDWAFINKAINATKENGTTIVVSPNGVLFNAPDEKMRKQVVEKGLLSCIISMPEYTLLNSSVRYSILIFKKNSEKIRFIDCKDAYIIEGKNKRVIDVEKIMDMYSSIEDTDVQRTVSFDEIKDNDWNLSVELYFNKNELPKLENPKQLKELASVIPGLQYTSKTVTELDPGKGEYDVVRITNLIDGDIDYENLVSIDGEESKLERYLLKENDIVIATKGTILKCCLVKNLKNEKTIFNSNLTVIRVTSKELSPVYLYNFLNSETGKTMLMMKRTGSIIMNISRNALQELMIPVIDMNVQETIVNRYHRLTGELKLIKKQLNMLTDKISKIYEEEVES